MFKHSDATTVWETVIIEKSGNISVVLMVETNIILNKENPKFDADRYNNLTTAIAEFIAKSVHFDRAEVHPINGQK